MVKVAQELQWTNLEQMKTTPSAYFTYIEGDGVDDDRSIFVEFGN